MKRTEMDNIVENMAEYICDHICQKAKETTDQEELEAYCAEECDIGSHICDIPNEYNKINNFGRSEAYKLMENTKTLSSAKNASIEHIAMMVNLTGAGSAQG